MEIPPLLTLISTPVVLCRSLVELIAEDPGGDDERADGEVENVTIHGLAAPFRCQKRAL
jgi:hypothetical protein